MNAAEVRSVTVTLSRETRPELPPSRRDRLVARFVGAQVADHRRPAAAIAGFVGAQVGMSTFTVLVTVGLATVAVITPPAELNEGSPPHENEAFVRAQPLSARYGLFAFM